MRTWLSTIPAVVLLVAALLHGSAGKVQSQLQKGGEQLFSGYSELRYGPEKPDCDPDAAPAPSDTGDDDDVLGDLFGDEAVDEEAAAAAQKACLEKHERYKELSARLTPGLRAYRTIETSMSSAVQWGSGRQPLALVLLILICAATITSQRGHIALRSIQTVADDRVSAIGQLAANALLTVSWIAKWRIDLASPTDDHAVHALVWATGFAVLAAINVVHLTRPREDLAESGNWLRALLAVPLYASMGVVAGVYFIVAEAHPAGPAIYLLKLTTHSLLYLHVGLYVWAGMLLKQTRVAAHAFDMLRPWKLPPELLAFVVVVVAAVPTAYSGASGIFVIAAGALIFQELRRAGARRSLALAATAMSGSLGVVLRPCLLVLVVASLNKQVTTDQLFHWGYRVFGLTSVLFLIAALITRTGKFSLASPVDALRGMLAPLKRLVPYALVGAAIVGFYYFGLDSALDEHSAPVILPVLLLLLLFYDRRPRRDLGFVGQTRARPGADAVADATKETTGHIGALLMLMGLSVCLGGVIERSELMAIVPETFSSPLATMSLLVFVLVGIGMIMDPYGAVILVTVTVAPVAYRNGIDPVHFWMVVLVAFELGYLTPPVALNHLLTRQVVGHEANAPPEELEGLSFFRRHERLILPISVMATALLIVAFGPLMWPS